MNEPQTTTGDRIELTAVTRLGLIAEGDDLPALIVAALGRQGLALQDGDVLVIAQKIVSKAEGRRRRLRDVIPSARAAELAKICGKDERLVELILQESREVRRCVPGVIIVTTRQGLVLANAGIDRSNVEQAGEEEAVLLLPQDPDASCATYRRRIGALTGADIGVVINDSLGRAWRCGTLGTAIGVSGLPALQDLRGTADLYGFPLQSTEVGIADEVAAAASLVMGQSAEARPVVLVRGLRYPRESGTAADLLRPAKEDLFP